ncbi:MAG: amidohydrolase family protein [Spirochaetes bacterium]|nr:amidohydrolase family protein [Spirochaetota bacterium]
MRDIIIKGGTLILPGSVMENGCVHVRKGKILHIGKAENPRFRDNPGLQTGLRQTGFGQADLLRQADTHHSGMDQAGVLRTCKPEDSGNRPLVFNAHGKYVIPALVEMHIHGYGGCDFEAPVSEKDGVNNNRASVKGKKESPLSRIAGFLSGQGVGYFLPTIVYDEHVLKSLTSSMEACDVPERVMGIYIEGPFISEQKRGGIHNDKIMPVDPSLLKKIYELSGGRLRMMTIAPEIPGALKLIGDLNRYGIIPALGHSNASLAELKALPQSTELNVTHLFNGMSGVSHKQPGLAHWCLLNKSIYTELNCDGTHVHPAAMELSFRLRPHNRIVMISDAAPAAGLVPGSTEATMRGKKLFVKHAGVYEKDSGVLVGSGFLVKDSIAAVHRNHGIPLWEVVKMAASNPLKLLGIETSGSLEAGMDADISVFDTDFRNCCLQLFKGKVMHIGEPV